MERDQREPDEIKKKDTSYAREGTGHHLRSVANKVREQAEELLNMGALAKSDVDFISKQL